MCVCGERGGEWSEGGFGHYNDGTDWGRVWSWSKRDFWKITISNFFRSFRLVSFVGGEGETPCARAASVVAAAARVSLKITLLMFLKSVGCFCCCCRRYFALDKNEHHNEIRQEQRVSEREREREREREQGDSAYLLNVIILRSRVGGREEMCVQKLYGCLRKSWQQQQQLSCKTIVPQGSTPTSHSLSHFFGLSLSLSLGFIFPLSFSLKDAAMECFNLGSKYISFLL